MSVIGFDLGNETCQIAAAKGGGIEVLDNEYSLRFTPSYVGFSGYSRNVGIAAKNKIIPNINNTIFNFKTILGKKFSNKFTQKELTYIPYDAVELPLGGVGVEVNYQNEQVQFSIQQITAILLTKLKSIAEYKTGNKIQDCVISVPIYYTDEQRRALIDAAEIAGLNASPQLLNETTAVALFYGFYKRNMFQDGPKIVVFVDLGHSALTVTACKFYEGKLSILGSLWNMDVGGRQFDLILVKYFADDFKVRYNIDVLARRKALMTLFLECEAIKKQMSANPQELEINIECLMDDIDVRGKMKREHFEEISASLLSSIEKTMEDLVSQCDFEKQDIDAVQIIGGSSRIPALKKIIVKVFGKEPQTTLNQDEAVARGCCLQCALMSPTLMTKPYQIEDIQPFAIKAIYKNDTMTEEIVTFDRLHKIPLTRAITFPYKGQFTLEIYYESEEGEFEELGKFSFADISQEIQNSCNSKVKVNVSINENGIFNVLSAKVIAKYENGQEKNDSESLTTAIVPYDISTDKIENESSSENGNDFEQDVTIKDKTKYYYLDFVSNLRKLDRNSISKYKNEEQKMRENDSKSQRIADLRNEIEEYIFYVREKLNTELSNFAFEEIKFKIYQCVDETEIWLYDSNDLQNEKEFYEHLNQLKLQFQPIMDQYEKVEEAKKALSEFQNYLDLSSRDTKVLSGEIEYQPQMEEIKERWNLANEFIRFNLNALDKMKSFEVNISANLIRKEMQSFQGWLQQMLKLDQESTIVPDLEKTELGEDINLVKEPGEIHEGKHDKVHEVPIELKYKD